MTDITKLIRGVIAAVFILLLAGCAEFAAFRSGVASHGADAADQALETAIWTLCNGSSVGAINRRFREQEERAAYRRICRDNLIPEGGSDTPLTQSDS